MNHGIDSTRSQSKYGQIYRDVGRFRSKESNQQSVPYECSRKPTSRHPPPCTPQNEAVLAIAHHSQKTCFTLSGRSCPRYLKHHSNMIPPPLQKKPHIRHSSPQFKENTNIHQSMALRCVAQGRNLNWPFGNQVDWQKGLLTSLPNNI